MVTINLTLRIDLLLKRCCVDEINSNILQFYYPKLRHIAMSLYTVPTSSAASERIWSIFDFIHCKRRNRLCNERVDKLVFLYANHALGANDNVLNDWFDDECN